MWINPSPDTTTGSTKDMYGDYSTNHQNKLCVSDYREIHNAAGREVIQEEIAQGNCDELLRTIRVSKEFHHYPRWEWFVDWYWTVSVPTMSGAKGASSKP
jgi:hypothetical protein